MWKKIHLLTVIFFLSSVTGSLAIPVNVSIKNLTTGNMLKDYPFTINIWHRQKGTEIKEFTFKTDHRGFFVKELNINKDEVTSVTVSYRGVVYRSVVTAQDLKELVFNINVYDITDKAEHISIDSRTLIVSPENESTLQIFEIIRFSNTADKTYIGSYNDELDTQQVLLLPMPSDYRLVKVEGIEPEKLRIYNKALITIDPIIPGQHEIILGYYIRSDIGLFDLTLSMLKSSILPKKVNLLLRDNSLWKLKTSSMTYTGKTKFYGKEYKVWSTAKTDNLKILIYGPTYQNHNIKWLSIIGAALIGCFLIIVIAKRTLRNYHLMKERENIQTILPALKNMAAVSEGYILFLQQIESRLKALDNKLNSK